MNLKELTKTFIIISTEQNPLVSMAKNISALRGLRKFHTEYNDTDICWSVCEIYSVDEIIYFGRIFRHFELDIALSTSRTMSTIRPQSATIVVFHLFYLPIKSQLIATKYVINPFNPEFTIVIFIHYKPRIAVAILDL